MKIGPRGWVSSSSSLASPFCWRNGIDAFERRRIRALKEHRLGMQLIIVGIALIIIGDTMGTVKCF